MRSNHGWNASDCTQYRLPYESLKEIGRSMERQERGKIAKAGQRADVPVVDGRPDAEEQEVRASEALGEPVRESGFRRSYITESGKESEGEVTKLKAIWRKFGCFAS